MRLRAFLAIVITPALAAIMAGQSPMSHTPYSGPARERWRQVLTRLAEHPESTESALNAFRLRQGLPFEFWADSATDSTRYQIEDAPCGGVTRAFCRTLRAGPPGLALETVLEFDATGRVVRHWLIDLNTPVDGVRGGSLLVPFHAGHKSLHIEAELAVEPSGTYRVEEKRTYPARSRIPCPPLKEFGASAYLRCWMYPDLATRGSHRIAYQGPCT